MIEVKVSEYPVTTTAAHGVEFHYASRPFRFECGAEDDAILQIMRRTGTFFEIDVLEWLADRLRRSEPGGTVVDAGAFVGTHTVFFARVCRRRVLAVECDPDTFALLVSNVGRNEAASLVACTCRALGAVAGTARLDRFDPQQPMKTRVDFGSGGAGAVDVVTIDELREPTAGDVRLIKIDVERTEIPVLAGALRTIAASRPILCVEIHTARHLLRTLVLLWRQRYAVVDCLGHDTAPTYVLEVDEANLVNRTVRHIVWLLRTSLPRRLWPCAPVRHARAGLGRLARAMDARLSAPERHRS